MWVYIYIYIYIYIFIISYLELSLRLKQLFSEVTTFDSLQTFYNSLSKAHSLFSMSNLQLIWQNCRTSGISKCYEAAVIAQRVVITDNNHLLNSNAFTVLLIVLAKTLSFWYLISKICYCNTVGVLCHFSAASFPLFRDFRNSP